jgi:hypothetical protein
MAVDHTQRAAFLFTYVHHRTRGHGWFLYPGLAVLVVFFFGMFSERGYQPAQVAGYGPTKWVGLDTSTSSLKTKISRSGYAAWYVVPFSLLPTIIGLVRSGQITHLSADMAPLVSVCTGYMPQIVLLQFQE